MHPLTLGVHKTYLSKTEFFSKFKLSVSAIFEHSPIFLRKYSILVDFSIFSVKIGIFDEQVKLTTKYKLIHVKI